MMETGRALNSETRFNRKLILSVSCLVFLLAGALVLPYWEFTGDDGIAFMATRALLRGPFSWAGIVSSMGIPKPGWVLYLYTVPLALFKTVDSVQVFVFLAHVAHAVILYLMGELLMGRRLALWASWAYFFAPIQFVFFEMKIWDPALLPLSVSATVFFLMRSQGSETAPERFLFRLGATLASLIAVSCHLSGLALVALVLLSHLVNRGVRSWELLLTLFLVALGLYPTVRWILLVFGKSLIFQLGLLFSILLLGLRGNWLYSKNRDRIAHSKSPFFAQILVMGIVSAWVRGLLVGHASLGLLGLRNWLMNFSPIASFAPRNIGYPLPAPLNWFGNEVLLFPAGLSIAFYLGSELRQHRLSKERLILLNWNLMSVLAFTLVSLSLSADVQQWFLFAVPGFFLGIGIWLLNDGPSVVKKSIALTWVLISVFLSAVYVYDLSKTGGISWHEPSYSIKKAVMGRIYSSTTTGPVLYFLEEKGVFFSHYDFNGWLALKNERPPSGQDLPKRFYYLHDNQAIGSSPGLKERISRVPGIRSEEMGPVTLFSSEVELKELGVLVDGSY